MRVRVWVGVLGSGVGVRCLALPCLVSCRFHESFIVIYRHLSSWNRDCVCRTSWVLSDTNRGLRSHRHERDPYLSFCLALVVSSLPLPSSYVSVRVLSCNACLVLVRDCFSRTSPMHAMYFTSSTLGRGG